MTPWNKKQHLKAKAKIETKFEILSSYSSQNDKIKVRNPRCGHIFESRAANLTNRKIECPVCNLEIKRKRCFTNNQKRHEDSIRSLSEYLQYERKVRIATRKIHQTHKQIINPKNLPIGRSGEDGAHQLDHIKSIKECYLQNIPAQECASLENLQVITWEENLERRDMRLQGLTDL